MDHDGKTACLQTSLGIYVDETHQMPSVLSIELVYEVTWHRTYIGRPKRDMVGRVSQVETTVLSLRSANKI
jgi:hypothetical protein